MKGSKMLLPSQPEVSKAAHQGQDPSMHPLSLRVPILPYGTPRTPRAFAHPAWTCRALVGNQEPIMSPRQSHCIPSARTCVTYASTSVPSCLPAVLGWGRLGVGGECLLVPSAGLGAAPMSIHGCWAAPWAVLCMESNLSHFSPLPPQKALEVDRDTGTGSVKIKPLFDWLTVGCKSVIVTGAGEQPPAKS